MNNKQVVDDFGTVIDDEKIQPNWADGEVAGFDCECGKYLVIGEYGRICTCGRSYRLHWDVYIEKLSDSPTE